MSYECTESCRYHCVCHVGREGERKDWTPNTK